MVGGELMQSNKPKIGVAFSGGGIRGYAHLAIIEALAQSGIRPDLVSGTSIGSGMAALFACGRTDKEVVDFALNAEIPKLFRLSGGGGILNGRKYAETFAGLVGIENLEEAPVPIIIVATDLISWRPYLFEKGSLATAIQASSAVPGAFKPLQFEDKLLVDGGLVNNCPADILRERGADLVIAIDLDFRSHSTPKNVVEIAQRAMEIMISQGRRPLKADYVIKPFERYISAAAVPKYRDCYELGKQAIEKQLPEIKKLICDFYEKKSLDWRSDYPLFLEAKN
jgi:NTE family protein